MERKRNLRLIVCGGRAYPNAARVYAVLDHIHSRRVIAELIEGGAFRIVKGVRCGADYFAGQWADSRGVKHTCDDAEWDLHGKRAGRIRNAKMLERMPDGVVAFPGHVGTAHMVEIAMVAGVPVMRIDW